MYTNLNLYYLNTLGITPWIKKVDSTLYKNDTKLLILHENNLSKKAKSLLNTMVSYIGIKDSELVTVHENQFSNIWPESFKNSPPKGCLAFGFNSDYFPEGLKQYCPLICTLSLDYVLNNPTQKRKVLEDLNVIKNLLQ